MTTRWMGLALRGLLGLMLCLGTIAPAAGAEGDDAVALRVGAEGLPWVSLIQGPILAPPPVEGITLSAGAEPRSLAVADLNADGAPDVIAGYAGGAGGALTVYLGVPGDGAQPQSAAFAPDVLAVDLPVTPDLLGAGDLNADGHIDIVLAAQGGGALWLLPGDGAGGLGAPEAGELPGSATALVVAELNRQDGLADMAVAVEDAGSAQVLVYQEAAGAWFATPEAFDLPARATDLAIGQLDGEYPFDLAIAAGAWLVVVYGRDRTPADAPPPVVVEYPLGYDAVALAVGDFSGGDDGAHEAALLGVDGLVRVVTPGELGTEGAGPRLAVGAVMSARGSAPPRLLRTNVSSLPADDLLLVGGGAARLLTADGRRTTGDGLQAAVPEGELATLSAEGAVRAALPTRLNGDALDDLVVLVEGAATPGIMLSAPVRTFVVGNHSDLPDASPGDGQCKTSQGGCSLRAAMQEANASAGADLIEFGIGSLRTLSPQSPLPIITEAVTIDGGSGSSQSYGYVNLDGAQAGAGSIGLNVLADSVTLSRLYIHSFLGMGVRLGGAGNHRLSSCRVGTDSLGAAGLGNRDAGVAIDADTSTVLSANIIVHNRSGVGISRGSQHMVAANNHIGVMPSATTPSSNAGDGISISGGANHAVGQNTTSRNVIAGNGRHGVNVYDDASGVIAYCSNIGVAADGVTPIGNGSYGVMIDGAPSATVGTTLTSYRNVIGGNLIGVFVRGATATGAKIQANAIGVDHNATTTIPQIGYGIYLHASAPAATVSGNIVGGNGAHGILVAEDSSASTVPCVGHTITGNWIGVSAAGDNLGNDGVGIRVTGASCVDIYNNQIAHNRVGVHVDGAHPITATVRLNTVRYHQQEGIVVDSDDNLIEANTLRGNVRAGLLVNGSSNRLLRNTALGEDIHPQLVGIEVRGHDNEIEGAGTQDTSLAYHTIGLILSGNGNVVRNYTISDSADTGIIVRGDDNVIGGMGDAKRLWLARNSWGVLIEPGASGNAVIGNRIGVNKSGSGGERYGAQGVIVRGDGNTIGGAGSEGNVIAGFFGAGVLVHGASANDNSVLGNRIGVDGSGGALGNLEGGIRITGGAGDSTIRGNMIAYNSLAGVAIDSGSGNRVISNTIHTNEKLGIDLGANGVTHNDTGDGDGGANGLQNYPVIASVIADAGSARIQGALSSQASKSYTLQFFLSDTCDDSGYGEGQTLLGQIAVTTDAAGRAGFGVTYTVVGALGKHVTATATDPDGNTSEFSKCAVGQPASSGVAFTVNTTGDAVDTNTSDGICGSSGAAGEQCTLRAAVQQANASVGADTIIVPAGTYTLTLAGLDTVAAVGDLDITDDLTIIGAGADVTTIAGAVADRVFEVRNGARVTMTGVTVRGGAIATTANGGGILANSSTHLTLDAVSVQGNQTSGSGGGIYSSGSITLTQSAVVSNTATGDGGGLALLIGSAALTNSTVSGNQTNGSGGGLSNIGATVRLSNVTVTANTADADGNGGDSVGGGGLANTLNVSMKNTIVAQNADGSVGTYPHGHADCLGAYTSEGYNLIGDAARREGEGVSCQLTGGSGDTVGGFWLLTRYLTYSAGLGTLQLNGGTTPNHMPVASGAGVTVDWGNPAAPDGTGSACEPFDQRGQPRPIDGGTDGVAVCDRGAVEHVPAFLSIDDVTVTEGEAATFAVSLSAASQITFTVQYSTTDIAAVAGEDYTTKSGTLTFNVGQTSKTISVTTLNDTLDEPDETFRVRLYSPQWVQIADGEGVGTILDDDAAPSIAMGDQSVIEGDLGAGEQAVATAVLSQPSGRAVNVRYALQDGTATAGADYIAREGILTFLPGETAHDIPLSIVGDDLKEGNETFSVVLSDPVNATIGDGTGTVTIIDDDVPTLIIADAARLEGDGGTGMMMFAVRLLKPSTAQTTVAYSTSPGTATAGSDYSHASGVLTYAAGETLQTIAVTIHGDDDVEPDETFLVTLSNPTGGATIGVATANGTILDDDEALVEDDMRLMLPAVLRP